MNIKPVYVLATLLVALGACSGGETPTSGGEVSEFPVVSENMALVPTPGSLMGEIPPNLLITEANCSAAQLGAEIPVSSIGEPVSAVTLDEIVWLPATADTPAHCSVTGTMTPVDTSSTARNIEFSVVLPQSWSHRVGQMGGGGMNGSIPNIAGSRLNNGFPTMLQRGFTVTGSDSGHQRGGSEWALNEEAMKNLAYMQLKKTHDTAAVLIERMYGVAPRFSYFVGRSQGGREALTVAQRYPLDYDGVFSGVPIVNFSSLMLGPELLRIQEKPLQNWVTPAKRNAIAAEVIRQCDSLDGLADGIIGNYMGCRAIFDITQGEPGREPWAVIRCPENIDPAPEDTSVRACLTDGQIETLEFTHRRYVFATPLANNNPSFGMWIPGTDPGGSGLITGERFIGQEGATENAQMHGHLGIAGVTGFLMQDLSANPLDYVEGGELNARRVEISEYLDATNPDLTPFYVSGGKLLSDMGTNDTLASPGSQFDYYQAVIDTMGDQVEHFVRFYPMPSANHGSGGNNYSLNGNGEEISSEPLATTYDQLSILMGWVEQNQVPAMYQVASSGAGRTQKLCSYPTYPHYIGGPVKEHSSYECRSP